MDKPTALPKIHAMNIQKAIALLNATGCKYKVIDPLGIEYGELKVEAPSTGRKKVNKFANTGYIDVIAAMKVGDVKEFTPPEGAMAEAFRKAIAGRASQLLGNGSVTTCIENGVVQAMRVK